MESNRECYSLWTRHISDFLHNYVGVYSLTNSQTNTVYVGSTTKSFNERWRRHIRDLQLNSHSCKYLQNSFNKYGCYSFSFSVLAQWEFDDASEIKIRNEENRQWNLLKSTGVDLFNSEPGLNGAIRHSDETISKIKNTLYEKWVNDPVGINSLRNEIIELSNDPLLTQNDVSEILGISRSALQRFFYRQDNVRWKDRSVQQKYKKQYEDFYNSHSKEFVSMVNDPNCTQKAIKRYFNISKSCLDYLLKAKNLVWISSHMDYLKENKDLIDELAVDGNVSVSDAIQILNVSKSSMYRFLKLREIKWVSK